VAPGFLENSWTPAVTAELQKCVPSGAVCCNWWSLNYTRTILSYADPFPIPFTRPKTVGILISRIEKCAQ